MKTGSDRRRVDFHTGLGQVWDRFGQVWAGLAMVFTQVRDRFEQVYEAECWKKL